MYLFLFLLQRYQKVFTYAIGKTLFISREIPIVYLHIFARAPRPNMGPSRLFTGGRAYCTRGFSTILELYYILQYVLQIGKSLLQVSKKMLIFAAGLG